jgi:hypothetical protein
MKSAKNPRMAYVIANSLLVIAAGVLGYAPVRALLVGAGTVTAAMVAAENADTVPVAAAAPAAAPRAEAAPAALGVSYKKDALGQFSHSNLIIILNTEGEIIHQRAGLEGGLAEATRAVIASR